MGGNVGGLQGIIRGIVARGTTPEAQARLKQERKVGLAEMERVRSRQTGRGTFLGGIQPFGGGQKRAGGGGGLFGGAASTAAQQTFGT